MTTLQHTDAKDMLSEYLDGALREAARGAVEAHVATCDECRRDLERLQRARAALSSLARKKAPAGFDARVADAIRSRSLGRFFGQRDRWERLPFMTISIVSLAVLALLLFLVWLHPRFDAPTPPGHGAAPPPPPFRGTGP